MKSENPFPFSLRDLVAFLVLATGLLALYFGVQQLFSIAVGMSILSVLFFYAEYQVRRVMDDQPKVAPWVIFLALFVVAGIVPGLLIPHLSGNSLLLLPGFWFVLATVYALIKQQKTKEPHFGFFAAVGGLLFPVFYYLKEFLFVTAWIPAVILVAIGVYFLLKKS